jgi:hypothetical protein
MDPALGRQSTRFNYEELLEPDGSVLFYKGNRRAIGKLRGATVIAHPRRARPTTPTAGAPYR